MIVVPRRFKCFACSRVRALTGTIPNPPRCDGCLAQMTEIDKAGDPLPLTLERAPGIERVGVFMTEKQAGTARALIMSALGETP